MTKNVTLRLNEVLLKRARHIAVEDEKSLSQWLAEILEHAIEQREGYDRARSRGLVALERKLELKGKIPSRKDLYEV